MQHCNFIVNSAYNLHRVGECCWYFRRSARWLALPSHALALTFEPSQDRSYINSRVDTVPSWVSDSSWVTMCLTEHVKNVMSWFSITYGESYPCFTLTTFRLKVKLHNSTHVISKEMYHTLMLLELHQMTKSDVTVPESKVRWLRSNNTIIWPWRNSESSVFKTPK